jgi:N,N'-diacetyllegionaminate synthase
MMEISVGNRQVGENHPCFIIAEAGINHNGDVEVAHQMIDAAANAGADCIKFQTFTAEEFCSGEDDEFQYVSQGKVVRESMLDLFKRHELTAREFEQLFEHARSRDIIPLSTPCGRASVDLLETLEADAYKIGSDDLVHHSLVSYIAAKGRPVIFSAGMGTEAEIDATLGVIDRANNPQAILLHCVSVYPTPPEQVNLRKISALQNRFDVPVGYSDHSEGIEAILGARALGAVAVEKHFTLDKNMRGPDHRFSSDPEELTKLVEGVRKMDELLGEGILKPTVGEAEMRRLARRSIVASRTLEKGRVLSTEDLAFQRPGTGLPPTEAGNLVGKTLIATVQRGSQLRVEDVE